MLEVRLAGLATGPGDGTPIVLLHGFPFDRRMWTPQQEALTGAGHHVILPDLRGHGKSPSSPGPATMELMARDLIRLLDRLQTVRAVLVGHSMGGYVALQALHDHPDRFLGLVLANSRADPDDEAARGARVALAERVRRDGNAALADALMPKLLSPASKRNADLQAFVRRMIEEAPSDGASNALLGMAERHDHRPLLPRISVPTLVVAGTEDPIVPPETARAVAQAVPGAELYMAEGTAHMSNLEDPQGFNRHLLAWLERFSP